MSIAFNVFVMAHIYFRYEHIKNGIYSVLVSHVVENKTWTGSAEKLVEFWEYLSSPTPDITKDSAVWKKEFDKNRNGIASTEAA
jgi:hypothetical protein